ncbi:MAG: CoA-binding protein, partial [Nanoarchaeota archaeon]
MRNLKHMFEPNSVAVIGASRDPGSVGAGVLRNLNKGGFFHTKDCRPFHGRIYPINPHATELQGLK